MNQEARLTSRQMRRSPAIICQLPHRTEKCAGGKIQGVGKLAAKMGFILHWFHRITISNLPACPRQCCKNRFLQLPGQMKGNLHSMSLIYNLLHEKSPTICMGNCFLKKNRLTRRQSSHLVDASNSSNFFQLHQTSLESLLQPHSSPNHPATTDAHR